MQGIEKDLEYLEQVWTITKEWEELWDAWKVGKFQELVTTDMETTSQLLFKRLNKLVREVKVRRLHSFRVNQLSSKDYTILSKIYELLISLSKPLSMILEFLSCFLNETILDQPVTLKYYSTDDHNI